MVKNDAHYAFIWSCLYLELFLSLFLFKAIPMCVMVIWFEAEQSKYVVRRFYISQVTRLLKDSFNHTALIHAKTPFVHLMINETKPTKTVGPFPH